MPHKRNPILSERIAGLARLLRGYAQTALEDQPLWHERDISHSSAERVILPDATILLDYMLVRMTGLVEGLSSAPSGCARTSSAASACTPAAACSSRSSRRRALARGGLRDRPARVAAGRRRARAAARPARGRPDGRRNAVARRSRRVLRRRGVPAPRPRGHRAPRRAGAVDDGRGRWAPMLTADRSSARARSATCTSCPSDRLLLVASTGSARSTSSCRRRSRTRAGC